MNIKNDIVVLITEDDIGHSTLIKKNLKRAGVTNRLIPFGDGREVLDFLFSKVDGPHREFGVPYLLLLDIRMPNIDGVEVLKQIKADRELKKMPVIMLSTTDDPRDIQICHDLGCSNYICKPVDYNKFSETMQQIGNFLNIVQVPALN